MQRRVSVFVVSLVVLFAAACRPSPAAPPSTAVPADPLQAHLTTYAETGGVARPTDAIDIYIVYSGGASQYMPELIGAFNRLSAAGTNPATGQPYASDERRVFVNGRSTRGGPPIATGVINALIAPNSPDFYKPTIIQPSVSHWLALVNYHTNREVFNLAEAQPSALSPVVMAIWKSRLDALRETLDSEAVGRADLLAVLNSPNGWQDFGVPDGRRAVYYGHTDPNISSTGLSNTITEFYTCARQHGFSQRRLTMAAVQDAAVQECVRQIETLVRHYARSNSAFLPYLTQGPDYLDFLAMEEADLICINTGGEQSGTECALPREPLVALYPEEGTFWHEYPLGIVNAEWVSAAQQAGARLFSAFLLLPDSQRVIMRYGFRPANPDVPLAYPIVAENGVDPAQPTTVLDVPDPDVIAAIQQSWSRVRKQADIVLLIDVSGSMNDAGKILQAREAALAFLDEMAPNNRVALALFADDYEVRVPLDTYERNAQLLHGQISSLRAEGGTELYYGITEAVTLMTAQDDGDRMRAVVVLSDGADTGTRGVTLNDAVSAINATRSSVNPVIVIPVAYGADADVIALNSLARASLTTVQTGDAGSIAAVLDIIGSFF